MKIVIVPDSFKESLTASDVAKTIQAGFSEIYPNENYVLLPVADGGEGTVETMIEALDGHIVHTMIIDPLGNKGIAFYGITKDNRRAIIEMAAASGLDRVPVEKRDAKITTSYGTGELILDALEKGAKNFIIGIGSSATNDGGAGMLQALGIKLLNKSGQQIGYGRQALADLTKINIRDMDNRLQHCQFQVACDVTNPLTSTNGASAIFGPQKGASEKDIILLDNNLKHFAQIIKKDLDIDIEHVPGTGAAGGMGAALLAFLNANLRTGIEIVTEVLKLDTVIQDADVVITGEGRLDHQSINGKVPVGVANIARKYNKPVIAIVGSIGDQVEVVYSHGITAMFSILPKISTLAEALNSDIAKNNLYQSARNIAAVLKMGFTIRES